MTPLRLPTVLTILSVLAVPVALKAQGREKTQTTDSGRVVLHYFTTGQLSTKEWMDKDDRWGRSWAYDRGGKELINYQTRKIGGHASIDFSYHANGAISKAEISDAPDGGIQWYRSTTTFDENGTKTGFTEQGQGNDGPIPSPNVRVMMKPEVVKEVIEAKTGKEEVVREQRMFSTELFVVNASKYSCRMVAKVKDPSPGMQSNAWTIAPGDTVRLGTYSTGETYEDAAKQVTITASRWSPKARKQIAYRILQEVVTAVEPEARSYYVVMGR